MRELFRTASVFVLPTLSDFYSIATLEAMAAGLPVILSNVGGTADIVVEASTGYLIEPGDGTALRSALETLLNDPSRCLEMGAQGRRRVEQHFDAKKSAGRLLELMHEIARPRLN
jgi:glycosyltransferase involved in cell wall biosynthesis